MTSRAVVDLHHRRCQCRRRRCCLRVAQRVEADDLQQAAGRTRREEEGSPTSKRLARLRTAEAGAEAARPVGVEAARVGTYTPA